MSHNPRSIFTGNLTSPNAHRADHRRLSTPEYHEITRAPSTDSQSPTTPLETPSRPNPARPLWPQLRAEANRPRTGTASRPAPAPNVVFPDLHISPKAKKRKLLPEKSAAAVDTLPWTPSLESNVKRRRIQLTRARHTFDHLHSLSSAKRSQPPSPLFFSHSKHTRPQLPARFSSSEAGARMLSKAGGEDGSIKTVTLARGTYNGLSPPGVTSAPDARMSLERSSISSGLSGGATPDSRDSNDPLRVLGSISIVELLEHDTRPTFIIDLSDSANHGTGNVHLIFANSCLRSNPALLEQVTGSTHNSPASPPGFPHFRAWLLTGVVHGEALELTLPVIEHAHFVWSCSTLRKRIRVISGTPMPLSPGASTARSTIPTTVSIDSIVVPASAQAVPPPEQEPHDYFGDAAPAPEGEIVKSRVPDHGAGGGIAPPDPEKQLAVGFNGRTVRAPPASCGVVSAFYMHPSLGNDEPNPPKEVGFFDWTRLPLSDSLPRHIQFARSVDWASTPLGPIEYWSSDLRQMCNLIMASPHPAAMYWGDDLVAIYNEAYVLLAGKKHPKLMGQSYKEAWAEIWDEVKDVFANAKLTGQATMKDDDCLFMKRNDFLEETYFSWSIIPMVGGDGTVMGLYNPAFEKTRRKIAERRMLTLREVGERTAVARDVKGFWDQVLASLATNEYDTPFVLLYSVSDESDSDTSSIHSSSLLGTKQCFLEGTLGVPPGHRCAPEQLELKTSNEGFGPVFREVMKTDRPVLLEIGAGDLPQEMLDGLEWRGFGDPCRSVVVCPIHPTTGDAILGFLVMGVNPRRPYDDDYSLFLQLLGRQLATSLASVVLFEEEIRRGQRAAKLAALDRIELSEQLAARTQEAKDSETRFTRMAEFSPAGLFIADSEGHITYCNDTWYEITRVPKDTISTDQWINAVKEEDQPMVRSLWNQLVEETKPITAEFRFKAQWEDSNGNKSDTWVLFSAYPEVYEQGMLKSVFGSITNTSPLKWAEGFQKRKMEEAIELKRQQENFIDITSHEMRNPLSAILQCADEISTSLSEFRAAGSNVIDPDLVSSSIDAAQTIALCAQHQKRIVDDVLTLSKLDSAMLMVTPVECQPLTVVQRALKMFEGEVQTADIQMKFVVDKSFQESGVDWVKMDPSRVLQVLINLTTNAIKFTTTESRRTITVSLAASKYKPSESENPLVNFFPSRAKRDDQTKGTDWGDGEEVYLQFAVQDTGRGLTSEEKKMLFLRFSQASPRTHVQYGGSGLGLFISRELTELQGGEIGVASEAGKGSTFAFYVKCRKTAPPPEAQEQHTPGPLGRQASDSKKQGKLEGLPPSKDLGTEKLQLPPLVDKEKKAQRAFTKVLIVEDNLVNQRVLKKQLSNMGFSIHVANHGGEALELLQKSQFWHEAGSLSEVTELSVLLMDQEMPVMDGLACTRQIREWEEAGKLVRHVPIIAVTANARSEQISALLAAGMDDVMSKPFRIPDLVPKIDELADKYPHKPGPLFQAISPRDAAKAASPATLTSTPEGRRGM